MHLHEPLNDHKCRVRARIEEMRPEIASDPEYTVRDQERMTAATRYFAWQSRLASREVGSRIVEVGCGIGNFTAMLADREVVVAIDVAPSCIEKHRQRFSACPNIHSEVLDACAPEFPSLASHRPDSVVCLNVLEHISNDLLALSNMASILEPRGKVILIVPAFPALYGPIDAKLGHHRRYEKRGFAALARRAGLKVVRLNYMNSVGFIGWWINAKLLPRQAQSESQIRIFDRAIVPAMSRLESLVAPPFGQSIFAILEKP
jgi:2-polyprenyl-3-methyl-5-hydroxy-6-metoxy-1,4-benzoquinol methylase